MLEHICYLTLLAFLTAKFGSTNPHFALLCLSIYPNYFTAFNHYTFHNQVLVAVRFVSKVVLQFLKHKTTKKFVKLHLSSTELRNKSFHVTIGITTREMAV